MSRALGNFFFHRVEFFDEWTAVKEVENIRGRDEGGISCSIPNTCLILARTVKDNLVSIDVTQG